MYCGQYYTALELALSQHHLFKQTCSVGSYILTHKYLTHTIWTTRKVSNKYVENCTTTQVTLIKLSEVQTYHSLFFLISGRCCVGIVAIQLLHHRGTQNCKESEGARSLQIHVRTSYSLAYFEQLFLDPWHGMVCIDTCIVELL